MVAECVVVTVVEVDTAFALDRFRTFYDKKPLQKFRPSYSGEETDVVVDGSGVVDEELPRAATEISAQFQNSSPNVPPLRQQLLPQLAQSSSICGCHAAASHPSAAMPR